MAEERVSFPHSREISTSRRISSGEKALPNYLRASTGSCHDLCKYGIRQEFEDKERDSTLKRVVANKLPRDKILSQSSDSPLVKRVLTKKAANSSLSSGKRVPISSDVKNEVRKLHTRAGDLKKREASIIKERAGEVKKREASTIKERAGELKKREASITKVRASDLKKREASTEKMRKKTEISLDSRSNNKSSTVSKLKSVAQRGSDVHGSRREMNTVTRKTMSVPKADLKKPLLPGRGSVVSKTLLDRPRNVKVRKGNTSLSVAQLKGRKEVRAMEAEKSRQKAKRGQEDNDLVKEKTLYVIKMETENGIVESAQNTKCVSDSPTLDPSSLSSQRLSRGDKSQEESESTVTNAASGVSEKSEDASSGNEEKADITETEEEEEYGDLDGKKVIRQRKNRALSSEDAVEDKAFKLRFRRGKTVDLVAQDNTPRRLKFRRGRILAGDDSTPTTSLRRTFFKTKGTNLNKDGDKSRSEKVSLKHQDTTQGKKDSRGLFNNVIEETASKLVETRKSKVKALVGAFETVISLQ